MKKDILFTLPSYFRDDMNIMAYRFGKGEKTCAVVGALRGDEVQQLYVCARLVSFLREVEKEDGVQPGKSVMIVPTVIGASMNEGSRLWEPENMDINRRFPGDVTGSTTERIAGALLDRLKNYRYGVQLTSFYQPGSFVPHVRMMDTGRQNPDLGCEFGLPYVYVRTPRSYDQTTLNYNWQLCGTQAYSLYAGKTREIDEAAADQTLRAIVRFLNSRGVIRSETAPGHPSTIITNADMISVSATSAGLLRREDVSFNWEDLRGKTIIGGRKGGVPEMTLEYVLRQHGLEPQKDVIVDTSVQFNMMAGAFTGGQGDYVTLFEPAATQVVTSGEGYILCSIGAESGAIPYTAYFASQSYTAEHDDVITAFCRAIAKALDWVDSHTDREVAEAIIGQFPDTSLDTLEAVTARHREIGAWNTPLTMEKAALERLETVMTQAGELTDDQWVDFDKLVDNHWAAAAR